MLYFLFSRRVGAKDTKFSRMNVLISRRVGAEDTEFSRMNVLIFGEGEWNKMWNLLCYIVFISGPIVYRLGHILLKDGSAVRFRVGSQRFEKANCFAFSGTL